MSIPIEHDDPINAKILSVSEDMISGFQEAPFQEIARKAEIEKRLDKMTPRITRLAKKLRPSIRKAALARRSG